MPLSVESCLELPWEGVPWGVGFLSVASLGDYVVPGYLFLGGPSSRFLQLCSLERTRAQESITHRDRTP